MFDKLKSAVKSDTPEVKSSNEVKPDTESLPPPHISEAAVQTFDIKYKDWKCIKALVTDLSTNTSLYQFDVPTITRSKAIFRTASDEAEIGRSQVNPFKQTLSVELHGQELDLHLKKALSSNYTFVSHALGGSTLTWEFHSGWSGIYYVLLDEQSLPVARWTVKGGVVFTNLGMLEFLGTKAESKEAKEEVLLTGLTLIYLMISSRSGLT